MLFGLSDTPLELKINEPGEVYISFNKHPWSGIVEIQDQEKIERFDLYAEAGAASYIFTYHVTGNQKVQISLGIILVMMFAVCFLTAVIYFILNKFREIWYGYCCNINPIRNRCCRTNCKNQQYLAVKIPFIKIIQYGSAKT